MKPQIDARGPISVELTHWCLLNFGIGVTEHCFTGPWGGSQVVIAAGIPLSLSIHHPPPITGHQTHG